jgi:superfamily I DNA/RNA helicase
VLILAGAGTGKTRVITFRIAHMIQRGIAPGSILGVTFTNKAAREMKARVLKLLPRKLREKKEGRDQSHQPTVCTFHSLCVRILRQHIEKLGYKRNFVIYDESDQQGAIKRILSHLSIKGDKVEPSGILAQISRLKNSGENARISGDPMLHAMARNLRPKYDAALRACNAVDFDDLILLTLRLFKEHPAALEDCRQKYQYVMVDEYQDTNGAQFQLIHDLTKEHRNFCVVGDDDQSIYGWRGAEIANLLDMEKHYPEVKVIKLEQNYRSTNTILNAANAVIRNNVQRRGKKLWSQNGDGALIALHAFKDDEEEAQTIVELIQHQRLAHRVPWADQAILFRTNAQSRVIETALRKDQVRYHLIGGQSFFDRREVRDFLAYIKAFFNPNDDISLLRIANVPPRGLSEVTMERLLTASQERKCSVFAAMQNIAVTTTLPSRAREAVEAFVTLLQKNRGQLHSDTFPKDPKALATWGDRFLSEVGYYKELRRSEKTPEAADSRERNLKDLIATIDGQDLSKNAAERLEDFLENVTLDTDREEEEEAGEAVTLITMHSCKGLEFPNVYVVGLEDGLVPHTRSIDEQTLDEERRLFYVAITRAKKCLTLSHCGARKKYGQSVPAHPSRFLRELPGELVENAEEKAKIPVTVEAGKDIFAAMRAAIE